MKINQPGTWVRFLILLNLAIHTSCAEKINMTDNETNNKLIEHSKTLSKENQFFWKGIYGFVAPNVYVKKNDEKNSLHDSKELVFQGGNNKLVEAIYIDGTAKIKKIEIDKAKNMETGILIVFSQRKVFVLNFNEKRFGWYER